MTPLTCIAVPVCLVAGWFFAAFLYYCADNAEHKRQAAADRKNRQRARL